MKKQLKIQTLKVKSFVTTVDGENGVAGGGVSAFCTLPQVCSGDCPPGSGEITCDPNFTQIFC